MKDTINIYKNITDNIESLIKGQSHTIRLLLAAYVSGGHILLEDYPGTGKTTLAKCLANTVKAQFKRIQFTPDLLPSDVTGISVYQPKDQNFKLHRGPVFTNILLADEINRASPRTQSALLESMAENQVSIDGKTYQLDQGFFVIATQNPVESRGTYPLPEAQLDRFAMQLSLGYVSVEDEINIVNTCDQIQNNKTLAPKAELDDIIKLRETAQAITVSDELVRYIVTLVSHTRNWPGIKLGSSIRASIVIKQISQALALFDGLSFVTPELIQECVIPVIAHRLILDPQAHLSGTTSAAIVQQILESEPVPV